MTGPTGLRGRIGARLRAFVPTLLTGAGAAVWVGGVALLGATVLMLLVGASPRAVFRLLFEGTWGSAYGHAQVLFKATPLILTGLSVSLGLRAGLFNIGVEGQLLLGAFGMALVGAALPADASPLYAVPLVLLVGAALGAALAALAGAMKAWGGAHEVLTTILLNFVVRAALVGGGKRVFLKESVHTAPIVAGATLPRFASFTGGDDSPFRGSALNASFFLAFLVAGAVAWLFARTSLGFRLRTLGAAPRVGETTGLSVARMTVVAMALSGAVAGLTGANFVLGYKHYFEEGFSGGVGYMGIAVAVLGGLRPAGIVLAALAFGTLSQGALAVNAVVPKELVDVLQALVILAVLGAAPVGRQLGRQLLAALRTSEEAR